MAVARGVADRENVVELVLDAAGHHVDLGLEPVVRGKAVERVARHRRRLVEQEGDAVVGDVVFLLVQVFQRHDGIGAEPKGDRRRHAEALRARERPAVLEIALAHQVDAHRAGVAEHIVHVGRAAHLGIRAAGDREILDRIKLRRLQHLVDHAAGRAAAEQCRGRALVDLDALVIEGVAVVEAGVAQPVHEIVVAG